VVSPFAAEVSVDLRVASCEQPIVNNATVVRRQNALVVGWHLSVPGIAGTRISVAQQRNVATEFDFTRCFSLRCRKINARAGGELS
jgi:hypothetical protein